MLKIAVGFLLGLGGFSVPIWANAYDEFDVKLCQATLPLSERLKCFRMLQQGATACKESPIEKELICRQSLAKTEARAGTSAWPKSNQIHVVPALQNGHLCRAVIAAVMARNPRTIAITSVVGSDATTSYKRESDGTTWTNKCSVTGNTVLWGTLEGRWRTEDKITVNQSASGQVLTVVQRFGDGSVLEKRYPYADLLVVP